MTKKEMTKILHFIEKICLCDVTFLDETFGSDKNKFYIDGYTEYTSDEEKQLILNWIENVRNKQKEKYNDK